mmetsp:Transcript_40811/g.64257  ORF Transcript_40811/g.64257 Transcript_40811/m.64257 type:complete len:109 (-) Transcript_40811:100-426(-)
MAQDLMAFDPQSPKHGKDDAAKPQDLLSSFDPLTAPAVAAPGSHATLDLPPAVAAAFNAPSPAPATALTPEEQRAQMMRAVQEDAKKMHAQSGKSDLDDPFKELADQK